MADIYKLYNQIKHYEWGSLDMIPQFLGVENNQDTGRLQGPCAEMWMGTHTSAPSLAEKNGRKINLTELINEPLPFLFKLLAAGKPLSIQAHPNLLQAQEGFERENKSGIAQDAPERNYRDNNHKPEILCALTHFNAMCGFRAPQETLNLLHTFLSAASPSLKEAFIPVSTALQADRLGEFFQALFALTAIQRKELTSFILENEQLENTEWKLMHSFALQYPQDPAVISPLYLNVLTLKPGQAIFVPAGVLHAYINGLGVELMANSDNVLRGGLTSKHISLNELMNILNFSPFMPKIITPPASPSWFRYPASCREFSLYYHSQDGGETVFPDIGAAICIVTYGKLYNGCRMFEKGESFFINPSKGAGSPPAVFTGSFSLFVASFNIMENGVVPVGTKKIDDK